MTDEQIQLNRDLQQLLDSSEKKLETMYRNGTAAECDYLSMKAERLNAAQQQNSLQAQRQTIARMLAIFCGIDITNPVKPKPVSNTEGNNRPELRLIDSQIKLADAQEKAIDSALMPRLNVFAQGFYGYPGLNIFEDMMRRQWTLNGMVGARLTWNIGALYTRKNDKARLQLMRQTAENSRDVFLFNSNIEQIQQEDNIMRYRRMIEEDNQIIQLRSKVRKAAESKLKHGIIDMGDLLREINEENAARLQQSMHEIEMLKEMYNRKLTTNN